MLKAVIFDMGGVLLRNTNPRYREKWAGRLGLRPQELEDLVFNSESGRQAQMGHKTNAAHWQWLSNKLGLDSIDLTLFHEEFFKGDTIDEELIAHIKRLREADFVLGLLSNATDNTRKMLTETHPIIANFDGVVISAEVGVMKPAPKIYHLAAESVRVQPEEALFIDDIRVNVEGARQVGMQAIHFTTSVETRQKIAEATGVA